MLLPTPEWPTLRTLPFAVLDLETTGGNPKGGWDSEGRFRAPSEISEVGVVLLSGSVVQERFESLCAIQGSLPKNIQQLTGITLPMLAQAPAWEQVALRLASLLEGRIWVAHHAAFDGAFLKAWLPDGLWKRHRLLCTRNLARRLILEAQSRSLASLCSLLNLHNRKPHRALPDAEATADLLQVLLERAEGMGLSSEAFLELGYVPWSKP